MGHAPSACIKMYIFARGHAPQLSTVVFNKTLKQLWAWPTQSKGLKLDSQHDYPIGARPLYALHRVQAVRQPKIQIRVILQFVKIIAREKDSRFGWKIRRFFVGHYTCT
jgi:hypothetical protein